MLIYSAPGGLEDFYKSNMIAFLLSGVKRETFFCKLSLPWWLSPNCSGGGDLKTFYFLRYVAWVWGSTCFLCLFYKSRYFLSCFVFGPHKRKISFSHRKAIENLQQSLKPEKFHRNANIDNDRDYKTPKIGKANKQIK